MRTLLASLALLTATFAVIPSAAAAEADAAAGFAGAGPFDEDCEEAVQMGCTWCTGGFCETKCMVYRGPSDGWGWGVGALFDAGLCIFIDCVPGTGCPPGTDAEAV